MVGQGTTTDQLASLTEQRLIIVVSHNNCQCKIVANNLANNVQAVHEFDQSKLFLICMTTMQICALLVSLLTPLAELYFPMNTVYLIIFLHTYIQVRLVNDSMQVLVNATTDITDTLLGVNDNNENFTSVFFRRTRSNTISALWSNGISISVSLSLGLLSFVASIPQEFRGTTLGLLGDFNGDASDDFMYRNGTFLDADASDSMIHAFGQSCKLVTLLICSSLFLTK